MRPRPPGPQTGRHGVLVIEESHPIPRLGDQVHQRRLWEGAPAAVVEVVVGDVKMHPPSPGQTDLGPSKKVERPGRVQLERCQQHVGDIVRCKSDRGERTFHVVVGLALQIAVGRVVQVAHPRELLLDEAGVVRRRGIYQSNDVARAGEGHVEGQWQHLVPLAHPEHLGAADQRGPTAQDLYRILHFGSLLSSITASPMQPAHRSPPKRRRREQLRAPLGRRTPCTATDSDRRAPYARNARPRLERRL